MNTGKTLFAQLMDFLPWTTFTRIVDRYGGDHRVRTLSLRRAIPVHGLRPADLPGKPARHRDLPLGPRIETLSHGLPPAGPALDAGRCQRKARLAYPCGVGPAAHHPGEDAVRRRRTGVGPDQYRLRPGLDDHRSVPVGLSVGALPHHQGGGEDAHAARPAGQHSEFYPHLGWQAARRSCPRYALAGSRSHLRRGSVATSTLPAFMCCTKPGPSSSRVPSRTSMLIASIRRRRDRSTGINLRPDHLPGRLSTPRPDYPELLRRIRFKDPESGKTLVFITNNFSLPAATICALYKSRWQVELFFKWDQAASSDQAVLRHVGERGEDADLDCRLGLRPRRHRQEAPRPGRLALHFVTDPLGDPLRENAHTSSTCGRRKQMQRFANNQPIEFIRFLT